MLNGHQKVFIKRVALTLEGQGITEPTEEQMVKGMRDVLDRDQELHTAFFPRSRGPKARPIPREFAGIIYKRLRDRHHANNR